MVQQQHRQPGLAHAGNALLHVQPAIAGGQQAGGQHHRIRRLVALQSSRGIGGGKAAHAGAHHRHALHLPVQPRDELAEVRGMGGADPPAVAFAPDIQRQVRQRHQPASGHVVGAGAYQLVACRATDGAGGRKVQAAIAAGQQHQGAARGALRRQQQHAHHVLAAPGRQVQHALRRPGGQRRQHHQQQRGEPAHFGSMRSANVAQ